MSCTWNRSRVDTQSVISRNVFYSLPHDIVMVKEAFESCLVLSYLWSMSSLGFFSSVEPFWITVWYQHSGCSGIQGEKRTKWTSKFKICVSDNGINNWQNTLSWYRLLIIMRMLNRFRLSLNKLSQVAPVVWSRRTSLFFILHLYICFILQTAN